MTGSRLWTALVVAALATSSTGCLSSAQLAAVRQFSAATTAVGDLATSEFVVLRNETISMNEARLTLPGIDPGEPDQTNLDESFDPEDVEARVRAAGVLKAYGELLLALATESQTEEIKKASDSLLANLSALPSADQKLDKEQQEALGTIVTSIGGLIVEFKRSKAIRTIVADTTPQIVHLCDLLARDFDPDGDHLATGFLATTETLKERAFEALEAAQARDDKVASLAAYRAAQAGRDKRAMVLARASQSLRQLRKAQDQLKTAMDSRKPSVSDIKEFVATAKALHSAVQVLAKGK